jgi:hypothetical protein
MGLVSPSQSNPNDTIEAADINNPINQLAAVINGGIDTNNIIDGGIATADLADASITGAKLATSAITLGTATITANITTTSTSFVDATGLTTTVTVPTGGRKVQVSVSGSRWDNSAAVGIYMNILYDGVVIGSQVLTVPGAGFACNPTFFTEHTPTSGSHTYKLQFKADSGTLTLYAAATAPFILTVKAV